VQFTVKDDEGWFSTAFPKGVDELYFSVVGVIKDVERLKSLYYLFAEVLAFPRLKRRLGCSSTVAASLLPRKHWRRQRRFGKFFKRIVYARLVSRNWPGVVDWSGLPPPENI